MEKPDQYPPGISQGEGAILDAIAGWRHEDREELAAKHAENQNRMDGFDKRLLEVSAAVKLAFPEGDADGHRRYHEAVIAKEQARARLYEKLLAELVSKGLWALVLFLGAAAWYYLRSKMEGK